MGKLPSIGYNGQPLRDPFRVVRPPIKVLVDLTVLFPREPHRNGRYHPHGLQMHKVVEGSLSCWGICEQGDWWGLVTYDIAYGSRRRAVTHWVPAWTLRRRPHDDDRRGTSRAEESGTRHDASEARGR